MAQPSLLDLSQEQAELLTGLLKAHFNFPGVASIAKPDLFEWDPSQYKNKSYEKWLQSTPAENLLSCFKEIPNPLIIPIDGSEVVLAFTFLFDKHCTDRFYINGRMYFQEDLSRMDFFFVSVGIDNPKPTYGRWSNSLDRYFLNVIFQNAQLPQEWYSPLTRRLNADSALGFYKYTENCSREKSWYISPVEELSQQVDYFTLDPENPNSNMLLYTHGRKIQSCMLVVKGDKGFNGDVDVKCTLDGEADFVIKSECRCFGGGTAYCLPLNLDEVVSIDELCAAREICIKVAELGVNATFSLSGLDDAVLKVNKAIPLWSFDVMW